MSSHAQKRAALAVAFRHFTDKDTSDAEREAILVVMADDLGGPEGEVAARMLHHRRQEAVLQLNLGLMFTQPHAP